MEVKTGIIQIGKESTSTKFKMHVCDGIREFCDRTELGW